MSLAQNGDLLWSKSLDFRVIPVECDPTTTPLNVSIDDFELRQSLIGLSCPANNVVFLHCNVLEPDETEVETDCGVMDDFSGTGYLNRSWFLFAVDKWEWQFSQDDAPGCLAACTICGISSRLARAIHERQLFLLLTSSDSFVVVNST
jgi:hypothetical protein